MKKRNTIMTLAHKELFTLLNAPASYVIAVLFLIMTGWFFASYLFQTNLSTLDTFLRPLPLVFTFVIPAFSMRTFSEEFKTGTIEYIATLPLKDHEIVLGKYLSLLGFLGFLLGFTLLYPLILLIVGRPDIGQMVGSYLAIVCLGSFFTSIGLWASSMTRNQVVAFIIGFFGCFFFFLLSRIADFAPNVLVAPIRWAGVDAHFDALARGVFDSRDIVYWGGGIIFFLSATLVSIQSRRWR